MQTRWSPVNHAGAMITFAASVLALLGAWIAGEGGRFLGLTQAHLFEDAKVFALLAIGFGVGTLVHRDIERHGQ